MNDDDNPKQQIVLLYGALRARLLEMPTSRARAIALTHLDTSYLWAVTLGIEGELFPESLVYATPKTKS